MIILVFAEASYHKIKTIILVFVIAVDKQAVCSNSRCKYDVKITLGRCLYFRKLGCGPTSKKPNPNIDKNHR